MTAPDFTAICADCGGLASTEPSGRHRPSCPRYRKGESRHIYLYPARYSGGDYDLAFVFDNSWLVGSFADDDESTALEKACVYAAREGVVRPTITPVRVWE